MSCQLLGSLAPSLDAHPARDVVVLSATSLVSSACFGSQTATAIAYLAAHILTMITDAETAATSGGSVTGAITSRKAGDLSVTYSTVNTTSEADALLASTTWGRLFLWLRKTRACGHARVVIVQ